MRRSRWLLQLTAVVLAFALIAMAIAQTGKVAPGNGPFQRTWERTDRPVAELQATRTWMWGPEANTPLLYEPYAESPGGQRVVQYFDKSRMEITNPNASDDGVWYVTNGLLVNELVTGRIQTGNNQFTDAQPAQVNIAGDPGERPTYADINTWSLRSELSRPLGSIITHRLDENGNQSFDQSLAQYGVTAAERVTVPSIDHTVASVFWSFMNSQGTIYANGQYVTAPLFQNPYYATGYPITEAWWSRITVGGIDRDLLWQCFERRCLTYNPANPMEWRVEVGNVGQHYYQWRYANGPVTPAPTSTATPTPSPSPTPTATATATPMPPTATPAPPTATPRPACHYSYPTVCIPPPPPDLDCDEIPYRRFTVLPPDPHDFDRDNDGVGCESG